MREPIFTETLQVAILVPTRMPRPTSVFRTTSEN
jgi:hypothetical protein